MPFAEHRRFKNREFLDRNHDLRMMSISHPLNDVNVRLWSSIGPNLLETQIDTIIGH